MTALLFLNVLPYRALEQRLQQAVAAILPEADLSVILIRPCPDPKFGDYQTNALMSLAKTAKLNPRQLAAQVLEQLDVSEWCEKPEIAGAGFINFRLKPAAMTTALQSALKGEHLFFEKAANPKTIVIDFSSPNVAKPMHVGHIRSTTLGDSLARTFRLLGHRVITDNHIGDWGTQFGKLLVGWKHDLDRAALEADPIAEMERLYKKINAESEADPAVLERARQELVKLQNGDAENLAIWNEMLVLSQKQFDSIYSRLGVKFDYALGESFYNPQLKSVVQELREKGIAKESDGATCVFSDGTLPPKQDPFLINKEGEWVPIPFIIEKQDGAANYGTTDLATIIYRLKTWQPDAILYVVDARQSGHFKQLFNTFRRWHPESPVRLEHVDFGKILGDDGKPFKTRSGDTVRLAGLLDEAEERAFKVVSEKNATLPEAQRREIARVVGIGSVKYADLMPNRQSDYVFSWDKMLALTGNTAPYLEYAYTRIRSIFRKGAEEGIEVSPAALASVTITLSAPEEIALGRHLLNLNFILTAVAEEYRPNYLCNYLFELASHYARFFESCPVLKAEGAERSSRLALCELTGRVLKLGLETLGMETTEQM